VIGQDAIGFDAHEGVFRRQQRAQAAIDARGRGNAPSTFTALSWKWIAVVAGDFLHGFVGRGVADECASAGGGEGDVGRSVGIKLLNGGQGFFADASSNRKYPLTAHRA